MIIIHFWKYREEYSSLPYLIYLGTQGLTEPEGRCECVSAASQFQRAQTHSRPSWSLVCGGNGVFMLHTTTLRNVFRKDNLSLKDLVTGWSALRKGYPPTPFSYLELTPLRWVVSKLLCTKNSVTETLGYIFWDVYKPSDLRGLCASDYAFKEPTAWDAQIQNPQTKMLTR